MAVSYSLFANAGYQFFDNNGQMLSGGKLYTYLAGTNTNLTTYSSSSGSIANSNPIVLDSSGRITSEIWVTVGVSSKYVLKSSADVLIATWDNIPSLSTALNGSGTANGVAYFNSINQFTSGANLTFDGNNLAASGSVTAGSSMAVGTNITVGGTATVTGTIASTGGITSATPAVTQSDSDSSTKIATTEFVKKYAPSAKIQTINATVASNQLTVSLSPTYLDFRASPITSNTITSVYAAPADLIVPYLTTLGMTSGVSTRLVILACLDGSTVRLAIANSSGNNTLDETNVISTNTSASLPQTIFSSTIMTNVPYRLVGFIDIACATAGTWASAPTEIQGAGGEAMSSVSKSGAVSGVNIEYWTSSGTWTVPLGITKAFVWVFGGAGGGTFYGLGSTSIGTRGGFGGFIAASVTGLAGTVPITVGTGGTYNGTSTPGSPGGTSSFGGYVTATGGAGGTGANGANGTASLALTATRIRALCGLEGAQETPASTTEPSNTATTVFVQSGLTTGSGSTVWSTSYLQAPGTARAGTNGMGGAVIIQY